MHLAEDDPSAVECMLSYLYKRDYKVSLSADKPGTKGFTNTGAAINGKAIAQFEAACQHCEHPHQLGSRKCGWCGADRAREPCPTHLEHVLVYTLADKYNITGLQKLSASRFEDVANVLWGHVNFTEAVKYVYFGTTEKKNALKNAIVKVLVTRPKLLEDPAIKEVLEETSLAFDVLMQFSARGTLRA